MVFIINEIWRIQYILNNTKCCKDSEATLDDLFSDSTLLKLNFIGIQHLEYLDIREIRTPEKPLKNPWPFRRVKGLLRVIKCLPWPLPWWLLPLTLGGLTNSCTSLIVNNYEPSHWTLSTSFKRRYFRETEFWEATIDDIWIYCTTVLLWPSVHKFDYFCSLR